MRFKEGDKVEFIYLGELKQGVISEVRGGAFGVTYQVRGESTEPLLYLENTLLSPTPVLKVPQFVADWYEDNKDDLEHRIWKYIRDWVEQDRHSDFFDFMRYGRNRAIETLIKMKDGYEVEKEPLYHVKLIDQANGYLYVRKDGRRSLSNRVQNDGFKTKFTESEIKAMDKGEVYWLLREPVEEAEGEA
ncbi:DUF1642 domain-containing protein [Listeria monocytogenes]|nr:DUF1642 domain-containing protein [Listeria monocytogenes]EAD0271802.1 DUF1642 domain-containing protein [Listeria monocytogenes]EAH0474606.1 DUF1642 domain-containing protein [Listeria monocytogenes]